VSYELMGSLVGDMSRAGGCRSMGASATLLLSTAFIFCALTLVRRAESPLRIEVV
jgi:hypothetical protein